MAVVKRRSHKKMRPKGVRNGARARVPEYVGLNGGSLLPGSLQLFDVDEESRMLVLADNVGAVEFERQRLKAESMNAITHDESDTISFRNYLLANYLRAANYFNALTLHTVPISRIKPPKLFQTGVTALELKKSIELQKASIGKINAVKEAWVREKEALMGSEHTKFYKGKVRLLEAGTPEALNQVVKGMETKLGCRLQDKTYHMYSPEQFAPRFRGDLREAPADYWEKYGDMVRERKEREVMILQRRKEEEEARIREEQRRKELMQEAEQRRRAQEDEDEEATKKSGSGSLSSAGAIPLQISMGAMPGPDTQTSPPLVTAAAAAAVPQQPVAGMVEAADNISVPSDARNHPLGLDQPTPPLPAPQQPLVAVGQESQAPQDMFEDYGSEPFNTGFDDEFGDLDNVFF